MRDSKPSLTVPILMSERLTLEPLTRAHSDGMFALWSEAEVCRYAGPAHDLNGLPITLPARLPSDSDKIIDYFLHGAAASERFRWAVLTMAERRFIGAAGCNARGACSEYAYHLMPAFWGHGYTWPRHRSPPSAGFVANPIASASWPSSRRTTPRRLNLRHGSGFGRPAARWMARIVMRCGWSEWERERAGGLGN